MNTQIIAIANQKGGVGKTTTCANLGIGLAQAGKKVLLIDGDPQGSLTISLGNPQPDKLPFTLSDAMGKILMDHPIRPGEGILHHAEGVDLMPADIQLSGMEVSLVNAMSRETILRQYLDTLKGQYSHILIDCQPSLGMLTVNALAAANRIITKREGVVQKVNQYGDAGEQVVEISFIMEGDVYRLIVHSKLPSAERFEHWVLDPPARRTPFSRRRVCMRRAGKMQRCSF